jgi:tryptophanyl-tRNA synthetase
LKDYNGGVLKYKDLKDAAADSLVMTLKPFRERREELNRDQARIKTLVRDSSAAARQFAEQTLNEVKSLTGLIRV